ncbi:hypothetical protein [Haloglycomyces albus]|uniref:hypothetical protein n=1 Tax=Haloglycomyces albus TaxID=526067 RepID=UPI0012EC649D|nr:hypothetical protein [Haloglycomyces albus]
MNCNFVRSWEIFILHFIIEIGDPEGLEYPESGNGHEPYIASDEMLCINVPEWVKISNGVEVVPMHLVPFGGRYQGFTSLFKGELRFDSGKLQFGNEVSTDTYTITLPEPGWRGIEVAVKDRYADFQVAFMIEGISRNEIEYLNVEPRFNDQNLPELDVSYV